jgi:hypothetical protein
MLILSCLCFVRSGLVLSSSLSCCLSCPCPCPCLVLVPVLSLSCFSSPRHVFLLSFVLSIYHESVYVATSLSLTLTTKSDKRYRRIQFIRGRVAGVVQFWGSGSGSGSGSVSNCCLCLFLSPLSFVFVSPLVSLSCFCRVLSLALSCLCR